MDHQATQDIEELFASHEPGPTWNEVTGIIRRISPEFDFSTTQTVYDDITRLYRGEYPGYYQIKTPYHDLPHILDVLLCAVRLMHGAARSGNSLTDREMTLVMLAMLFHDTGYAQLLDGTETGTGAQYTKMHVMRSIEFMRRYVADHELSSDIATDLGPMIFCSEPMTPLSHINFPNERIRMLGQIVGTADLVGQMADRNYLEKLTYLYEEFEEGDIGDYQSLYELVCKTNEFYSSIKDKLDHEFGGIYNWLEFHFQDTLDTRENYYIESIEKNMAYLQKLVSLGEPDFRSHLRRGGIIRETQQNPDSKN